MRRIWLPALLAISFSGCASLPFPSGSIFSSSGEQQASAQPGQSAFEADGAARVAGASGGPNSADTTAADTTAARIGQGPHGLHDRRAAPTATDSRVAADVGAPPIDPDPHAPQSHQVIDTNTADLWQRIRAGFAMPELDTKLVAEKERFYLERPDYLQRMFERGSRYLYFIVDEIEKRGMPTELALLPFVESAMNPNALSSAQAAGLWQFIPSTGRVYDLSQNWWVDNRRDVVKSTQAALDYLQKVYEMQGNDWFLALASYNAGEGAVQRAMRRNERRRLPTDYLSIRLPNETRHYVPKLIALKNIVLRSEALGVALPAVPNRPYFVTIEKTRPIDLKLAAQFADMSVEEFVALNPAHNRPVIAASRNNQIVLPADREQRFLEALERHIDADLALATWQPYELKPGETLEDVARRAGITLAELREANDLPRHAVILPGSRILAPQRDVGDEMQVEFFRAPRLIERVALPTRYHSVRRNDTLSTIARHYGTSVADIRRWNKLRGDLIRPGMRLVVGLNQRATVVTTETGVRRVVASPAQSLVGPQYHEVQRKDTLSAIAKRYGTSVADIKRWNGLRSNLIRPGMRLIVRPPASKVVQGDTEQRGPSS